MYILYYTLNYSQFSMENFDFFGTPSNWYFLILSSLWHFWPDAKNPMQFWLTLSAWEVLECKRFGDIRLIGIPVLVSSSHIYALYIELSSSFTVQCPGPLYIWLIFSHICAVTKDISDIPLAIFRWLRTQIFYISIVPLESPLPQIQIFPITYNAANNRNGCLLKHSLKVYS